MKNRLLDFRRPQSCERDEALILHEHEQAQARVVREHERRQVEPRELVSMTCPSTTLGFITDLAGDLERAGIDVSLRWLRDDRGDVIGIRIVQP